MSDNCKYLEGLNLELTPEQQAKTRQAMERLAEKLPTVTITINGHWNHPDCGCEICQANAAEWEAAHNAN